eukprot:scaffold3077_cov162-Amphora_coffeaeformis.AAC.15
MSSHDDKSNPDDSRISENRLTSLLPSGQKGGLQPKKPPRDNKNDDDVGNNTKPQSGGTSLLGLDRLAATKRQEQQLHFQGKSYRRQYDETPSHPGGVNREVQSRTRDRHGRGGRDDDPPVAASGRKRIYDDDDKRGGSHQRRRYHSDDEDDDRRQRGDHHDRGRDDSRGRRDDRYAQQSRYEDDDRRRGGRNNDNPRRDDRRDRYSEGRPRDSERRSRDTERRPRDSELRPRDSRPRDSERRPRDELDPLNRRSDFPSNMPPPPSRGMTSTRRPPTGGGLLERPTPGRPPSSSWNAVTPAPRTKDDTDDGLKSSTTRENRELADDDSFDRQFYLQEDEGHYVQDAQDGEDLGRFLYDSAKIQAREKEMEQKRQNRMTLRQAARQDDQDAWEQNRLRVSGATAQGEVSLDISTEQDTRVTLLVHQVKPPFLDGRVSFSKIREAVPTVRDASSDFAKMSREGSETLRTLRAKKEKNAMRQKFWELGGTRMGEAVGIKKEVKTEEGSTAAETANGEIDYKKSSGFADHVKSQKDGAVSKFAREKSIRQQREYLPVFTVREELLSVIRENNVVIIVGETGSGKVCAF